MKKFISILSAIIISLSVCFSVSAENRYNINGKSIGLNDVEWPGSGECWKYASEIYQLIWGQGFNGDRTASDNMLRLLDDSCLTMTEAHLKEYVTHCEPGCTIRICDSNYLGQVGDGYGHSQIIVSYDDNGFTFLESLSSGLREAYYTWSEYVNSSYIGQRYHYIKYIKWPGAPAYKPNDINDPADIIIQCKTEDGTVLSDTEFKVFDDDWNCVFSGKCDDSGKLVVSDLKFGYYTVVQENTIDGYVKSDSQEVSLLYGGDTTTLEFVNSVGTEDEEYYGTYQSDLDGDGIITRDDLRLFFEYWYESRGLDYYCESGDGKITPDYNSWSRADFNGDGKIGRADYSIFCDEYYYSRNPYYYWWW